MEKIILTLVIVLISAKGFGALGTGSVSTATGGSGRAAAEPVDSVLLNPAVVAELPTKFFSATYNPDSWGITISDNGKDALFPAALAFQRSDIDNLKTQQLSLALSYSYKNIVAVGTNLSMLEYNQGTQTYDQKYRQSAADFGIVINPIPAFGIALVASKAFSSKTELNESLQKQKTLGLGTQYTLMKFVRFRFDIESAPENKTDQLVYMGGVETYMNDWVVLRLGYQNNNVVGKNYSTAGIGFTGPQFGLHYAYTANVVDGSEDKHSIDLGIPF